MPTHLNPGPKGAGMSYEVTPEWGCLAKQSFRTRHDADRCLNRPGRRVDRHFSRGKCESYRCDRCGAWHVGAGK